MNGGRSTIFLAKVFNPVLNKIVPKSINCLLARTHVPFCLNRDKAEHQPNKSFLVYLLLASFFVVNMPQQAAAFELFGIHLWGKKKVDTEDQLIDPKKYTVTIEPMYSANPSDEKSVKANEANVKIAKKGSALWGERKKGVASGSGGLLVKARGDYRRILADFYAAGHYGPQISIKINGQEAADIADGIDFPDTNKITIFVDGGPQYRFAEAAISTKGWQANPKPTLPVIATNHKQSRKEKAKAKALADPEAVALQNITKARKDIGYKDGEIAKSGVVFSAEDMIVDKWRKLGYAKAKIKARSVVANHKNRTIETQIIADPGRRARFGPLTIHNVSKKPRMDSDYVAWMMGLEEGEIYSPDALAKATDRLNKLDVFSSASLQEAEKISANGELPLNLTLQEKPLHRFGGGGSYSTIDGISLTSYWLHRNLFGHAERLRFDAAVSNIANKNASSYSDDFGYSVGGTFTRPGIITPETDYFATLKAGREISDTYIAQGAYFNNGFNHSFNDRLSGSLSANASKVEVKDDTWGKRDFTTIGLLGSLHYDSRDNSEDASRGYYADIAVQPFYETNYQNFVGKITAEGRTYHAFDKDKRFILALRGKVGSISGAEIEAIPSNMLYFIGGGGSVRGYAYRSIGIYEKNGETIGGRSMVEGSAELRTMLTDNFGLVGFADAGIVGEKPTPDFDQDTKVGVGLGLRYKTGMGPLRFDVAMPLNREEGDSHYGFYIGIGQSF